MILPTQNTQEALAILADCYERLQGTRDMSGEVPKILRRIEVLAHSLPVKDLARSDKPLTVPEILRQAPEFLRITQSGDSELRKYLRQEDQDEECSRQAEEEAENVLGKIHETNSVS